MSTTTWVELPATALKTAARLPPGPSGRVKLLARMSPRGTFRVELVGLAVAVGVTARKPAAVCPTRVTLPVTATASAGTVPAPATGNVRGAFAAKTPASPVPIRVSTIRDGASGAYVDPAEVRSWETSVIQPEAVATSSACQTASGTCGSWATPT